MNLLALILCSLFTLGVERSEELLPNPGFSKGGSGYVLKGARVVDRESPGKGQVVELDGVRKKGTWTNVGVRLTDPPIKRELTYSLQLFSEQAGQTLSLNAFAYGPERVSLMKKVVPIALGTNEWTEVEQVYVLPEGVVLFEIWVINETAHTAYLACPRVESGKPARPELVNLRDSGVLLASAQVGVSAASGKESGVVTFPIPLLTDHQVPLTFDLIVEPKEALLNYRWVQRDDQRNWLCEVTVAPPVGGASVRWEALVLVDQRQDKPLPVAKKPKVPAECEPWIGPTACIQSDDGAIVAKSKQLGANRVDVGMYVDQVLEFTSTNKGKPGAQFKTLDAASAMDCGGSCTSRANLAAALLRAGGIPARTSAHLPTWSGPLYEHWHVEYWHPGVGWTWIEPTLGQSRPQPVSMVVINVANPEDEQLGFDPIIGHSGVMLGVPRYSVHEFDQNLVRHWIPSGEKSMNWARAIAQLDGGASAKKSLFKKARSAWTSLATDNEEGIANPKRTAKVLAVMSEKNLIAERVTKQLSSVLGRF